MNLNFSRLELAPAPHISQAVPPTIETLSRLLEEDTDNSDLHFAVGNLFLSEGQTESAIGHYREVLKTAEIAGVRCNLGIALLLKNNSEEAISELSKAVLQDPILRVAHLYLGRAHLSAGDEDSATVAFEKVIATNPDDAATHAELGRIYDETGKKELAEQCFMKSFDCDRDYLPAQVWLGMQYFEQGKELFAEDKFVEACALWAKGYADYPQAFYAEAETKGGIKALIASRKESRQLQKSTKEFHSSSLEQKEQSYYPLFLELYFSLGLIPEVFEPQDALGERLEHWLKSKNTQTIFPYVHYRIGLLHCYLGQLSEAFEELTFARDHLPASKRNSLRVDEIASFAREISRELMNDDSVTPSTASSDDWKRHGFEDPFSQQAWRKAGLHPKEAARWRDIGFLPKQVANWNRERITVDDAERWHSAGFDDPTEVRKWHRAGFSPEQAVSWQKEFEEHIELAIQSYQAGFHDPKEAAAWLEVFMFPSEAIAWKETGFDAAEAKKWMKSGVKDPFVAKQQKDEDEAVFAAALKEEPDEEEPDEEEPDEEEPEEKEPNEKEEEGKEPEKKEKAEKIESEE